MDPIDQIKAKIDIVDLISSYFPLKKMGRNFAAQCPFHQETKPSFMVSPDRQIFRCFGCEAKGDIFGFIQQKEGLTFREALEFLAKKAQVSLPRFNKKVRDEKERLVEINKLTAKLYHHILLNTKTGSIARQYLQERKIDSGLWEKFYLGFAPKQSVLEKFLVKAGFNLGEIAQSGLLIAGEFGSFFDRFRGRVVFPIFSATSEAIVGFSGRSVDVAQEPKYLNSPETLIFTKGANLYGLNLAKEAIRQKGFAILTEGEFDVISSHKVGIENVVGVKGTSLTSDQIKLISRFCDQISICFDTDLAGDAAARRGIELADSAGLSIKVIRVNGAKDPDEAVRKSANLWKKSVEEAVPVYDWLIDEAAKRYDSSSVYGKKKISDEIVPILTTISDEVVAAHYFQKLANKLDLLEVALWNKAARFEKKEDTEEVDKGELKSANPQKNLSEYFLALILQGHKLVNSRQNWPEVNFISSDLKSFYQEVIITNLGKGNFDLKSFAASLAGDNLKILDSLLFVNLGKVLDSETIFETELKKTSLALGKIYYKEKIAQTLDRIKNSKKAEYAKFTNNLNWLLAQLATLQKE